MRTTGGPPQGKPRALAQRARSYDLSLSTSYPLDASPTTLPAFEQEHLSILCMAIRALGQSVPSPLWSCQRLQVALPQLPSRATLAPGVAERAGHAFGAGTLLTVGFLHGQSAYELDPLDRLDYVGLGFKPISGDRTTWRSAGICVACCPIRCPSRVTYSLVDPRRHNAMEKVLVCARLRRRANRAMHMRVLLRHARPHGGNAAERVKQLRPHDYRG